MINKGTAKLIKMTAKSISFFILFASFIYNSYFVFNDDLSLIIKQYKNSLKSG